MKPLRHFDNLDALRFIAFFSVFCLHMVSFGLYFNGDGWYRWIEESLLLNGDLGVNFFFTLSGFLITNLLLQEREDTGKINIGSFYARRFLRIWPLYFALVFVGFFVLPSILNFFPQANPFKPEFSLIPYDRLGYYLGFLVNFDLTANPYPSPVLAVLWSISVEEQFYIFWPLLIAMVPRKYLIYSLLAVLIGTALFRFLQWHEIAALFNQYQMGNVDIPHPAEAVARFDALRLKATYVTRFHTFSILSDITMGALLAYGLFYSDRVRNYFKNLPQKSIVLPYMMAIGLIIIRDETYSLRFYSIIQFVHAIEPMLFSFIFAFIIGEQHYAENSFYKFGKLRTISSLGKYSYGMYIWHLVVIWGVFFTFKLLNLQPKVDNPWVFLSQIIMCFLITLLVARISYTLIETPFLKFRNRFRSGKSTDHFIGSKEIM
jgi:peptidoglycan/LPS O-acetylase OafA/YrhL